MSLDTSALVRSLRPTQWIKNVLVAAAPIAAGVMNDGEVVGRVLLGFVAFCLAASAVYLLNDAADAETDRMHPTKRLRPIAAGELSEDLARQLAAAFLMVSLALGAVIEPWFGVLLALYVAINIAYSFGLKGVPFVELVAVASGFLLRAVGGGQLGDVPLSASFLVVVSAGAMLVVSGKRRAELLRLAGAPAGVRGRAVLDRYSTRGLTVMSSAAAAAAIIGYGAWAMSQETATEPWDLLSMIPFTLAIMSYERAIRAGRGEDPEEVLRRDRWFQVMVLAWAVVYGIGVYV